MPTPQEVMVEAAAFEKELPVAMAGTVIFMPSFLLCMDNHE